MGKQHSRMNSRPCMSGKRMAQMLQVRACVCSMCIQQGLRLLARMGFLC